MKKWLVISLLVSAAAMAVGFAGGLRYGAQSEMRHAENKILSDPRYLEVMKWENVLRDIEAALLSSDEGKIDIHLRYFRNVGLVAVSYSHREVVTTPSTDEETNLVLINFDDLGTSFPCSPWPLYQ